MRVEVSQERGLYYVDVDMGTFGVMGTGRTINEAIEETIAQILDFIGICLDSFDEQNYSKIKQTTLKEFMGG